MLFLFSVLSILIYIAGFLPYIYHTFRGSVVPHPFSWSVWSILLAINTFELYLTNGLSESLLSPLIRTVSLTIGALVGWYFFRKIERITLLDWICLGLALSLIGIAFFFGVSKAILPTIVIDFLILTPTLRKIWNTPESEDTLLWITTALSQLFLLLSIGNYTFDNTIFWVYNMSTNFLVALFIFSRTRFFRR